MECFGIYYGSHAIYCNNLHKFNILVKTEIVLYVLAIN